MDPLTILMWVGIMIGCAIAAYIIFNLLIVLFGLAVLCGAFLFDLIGTIVTKARRNKTRKTREGRGVNPPRPWPRS